MFKVRIIQRLFFRHQKAIILGPNIKFSANGMPRIPKKMIKNPFRFELLPTPGVMAQRVKRMIGIPEVKRMYHHPLNLKALFVFIIVLS